MKAKKSHVILFIFVAVFFLAAIGIRLFCEFAVNGLTNSLKYLFHYIGFNYIIYLIIAIVAGVFALLGLVEIIIGAIKMKERKFAFFGGLLSILAAAVIFSASIYFLPYKVKGEQVHNLAYWLDYPGYAMLEKILVFALLGCGVLAGIFALVLMFMSLSKKPVVEEAVEAAPAEEVPVVEEAPVEEAKPEPAPAPIEEEAVEPIIIEVPDEPEPAPVVEEVKPEPAPEPTPAPAPVEQPKEEVKPVKRIFIIRKPGQAVMVTSDNEQKVLYEAPETKAAPAPAPVAPAKAPAPVAPAPAPVAALAEPEVKIDLKKPYAKAYHISKQKESGKYQLKPAGSQDVVKVFASEDEALKFGHALVKKGVPVRYHTKDGRITNLK